MTYRREMDGMRAAELFKDENIGRELRCRLIGIRRLKIAVHTLTVVVYTAVLCWIIFCVYSSFGQGGFTGFSEHSLIYVAAIFIGFLVLHFLLMYSLMTLRERETQVMRKAVGRMFPEAAYSASCTLPQEIIEESSLFGLFPVADKDVDFTVYGSVSFHDERGPVSIYDIGVTASRFPGLAECFPAIGYCLTLFRSIVLPIFGVPVESSRHAFRGMFGLHAVSFQCNGRVILLPDRLESRMGSLAHAVQSYHSHNGAGHVMLRDAEFEEFFAVYADYESEARKVLTPMMMRRIVELRRAFGRELFISFSGDRIYYAVAFPEGFLRPYRKALNDEKLFERIFHDVGLGRRLFFS